MKRHSFLHLGVCLKKQIPISKSLEHCLQQVIKTYSAIPMEYGTSSRYQSEWDLLNAEIYPVFSIIK